MNSVSLSPFKCIAIHHSEDKKATTKTEQTPSAWYLKSFLIIAPAAYLFMVHSNYTNVKFLLMLLAVLPVHLAIIISCYALLATVLLSHLLQPIPLSNPARE